MLLEGDKAIPGRVKSVTTAPLLSGRIDFRGTVNRGRIQEGLECSVF